ncbi:MAG: ABC transporter ATP-binding protein [Betaproteobacteria bacterium]|nr:ABC transporter ATP-binding protein [Betaproteobacteria bacterium]
MTEPLICARGLAKKYCKNLRRSLYYGVQDVLAEVFCRDGTTERLRAGEFWALEDASFDLHPGESLGIVGRNGAGKSTLLKLAAGIIKPDRGRLAIRGRVGALIALGAGFNPLLTGRENIYVSGMVLGHTRREIDALVDEIIDFSGLQEFIDMPVQNYSSGMYVRLGFAVAVQMQPDIMLVDEVLAVGDSAFQRKCYDRIYRMQARGTSFVVVSHNPYQIERLCQKATVLNRGRLSPLLDGKDAVALYHEESQADLAPGASTALTSREGTHELHFERIRIEGSGVTPEGAVVSMDSLSIVADVVSSRSMRDVRFRFEICAIDNSVVSMVTTIGLCEDMTFHGAHRVTFTLTPCQLTSGWYYLNAVALDRNLRLDVWQRAVEFRVLLRDAKARNLTSDNGTFVCSGHWTFS